MRMIARMARPGLGLLSMAVLAAPGGAAAGGAVAGAATAPLTARAVATHPPTAYVSLVGQNGGGDTVRPVNTVTNAPGKPIKVAGSPGDIAITPDGKTVYVVNGGGPPQSPGTVTPITTATNKPGKPVLVGDVPDAIAITPDGKTVYVANLVSDTVTPIATASNKPGRPIAVGVRPQAIVITPDGKRAYVVNQGENASGPSPVTPISTATNKPGRPIPVGTGPLAAAVTPNGRTVYVSNFGELRPGHTVTPIATATDKPGKPINVGSGPFLIAVTPDGKTAYVITRNSVTPISTATNTPGKPIKVGSEPGDIAITPDGKTVYVVSDSGGFGPGTVTPISTATNTAGKPIKVGSEPGDIAIAPDGKTAYVTNIRSGTVTPISTATNTPGKPISVGRGPFAIAITPATATSGHGGTASSAGLPATARGVPARLVPARAVPAKPAPARAVPAKRAPAKPEPAKPAPAKPAPAKPAHAKPAHAEPALARPAYARAALAKPASLPAPGAPGVLPGAAPGLRGAVLGLDLGGVRYEIPQVALPYLGRGLSPGLFRAGSLARLEAGGRLPVTVTYHGRLPALPGVTITHAGAGVAAGYLTATGNRAFSLALARQFRADRARGSYGRDGLFAGRVSIGPATAPAPGRAPARRSVMHTLTVTGTSLAGKPDTGDTVLVLNADNSKVFADPIEAQQVFSRGVARFSVPAGHYWAIGSFANLYPGIHLAVLPQFGVFRNTTVAMDGRTANSKLDLVTPRPAVQDYAYLELRHPTPAGPAEVISEFTSENPIPIYVSPTTQRPTAGTLQVFPFEQLISQAPGNPYLYNLAYQYTNGLIPPLHRNVSAASLATAHARYYSGKNGFGVYFQDAWFRGQDAPVVNGFFPLGLLQYIQRAPRQQTVYYSASPSLMWTGFFIPADGGAGQSDGWRFFRAGGRVTQAWNAYPLHEGYNVNLAGAANPAPWVPSASRAGNTLTLDVTPFSDSVPGHLSDGPFGGSVTGRYRIAENGKQLASGNPFVPNPHSRMFGEFESQVPLTPQPGRIRFALKATDIGRRAPPLSPAIRTAWVWHSSPEKGATVPPGWTCKPTTTVVVKPVRACVVEPMMTLGYGVAGLGLTGTAPAGQQTLRVTVGHLQDAKAAPVTAASVSVSFDGGTTWHAAHVSGHAGIYTAVFSAPAGASVTLRTDAADAAGGSITETITSAYKVAS